MRQQIINTGFLNKKKNSNGRDYFANQKYKAVFDNSPEAIVLLKKSGNIENVNGRVFDWLGYKPEEIIGCNFRKLPLLTYKSKLKIAKNLIKRLRGIKIKPYELEFIHINGKTKIGKISVSTIKDEAGNIRQIMVVITDVTKSKEIEKEIHEKQNQLNAIFSVSTDILILMDRKFIYKTVNAAFCKYMNMDESEVLGKTDFDIYPKSEAEYYRKSDMAVLSSGMKWEEDVEVEKANGKKWFNVIKAPVFDHKGTVSNILISIRDITERKLAENRLKHQNNFLDKLFEFSANGLVLVNQEKEIVKVNEKSLELFGRDRKEILGKCSSEYIGDGITIFDTDKNINNIESTIIRKDGSKLSILRSVAEIRENNETYWLESFVDITERKRLEDKISRLVKTLMRERSLFKKGPVVVIKWNNQKGWPIEKISQNAKEVLGYTVEELTSGNIKYEDIILKEDLDNVTAEVK